MLPAVQIQQCRPSTAVLSTSSLPDCHPTQHMEGPRCMGTICPTNRPFGPRDIYWGHQHPLACRERGSGEVGQLRTTTVHLQKAWSGHEIHSTQMRTIYRTQEC